VHRRSFYGEWYNGMQSGSGAWRLKQPGQTAVPKIKSLLELDMDGRAAEALVLADEILAAKAKRCEAGGG
jgi:hypothetical protein